MALELLLVLSFVFLGLTELRLLSEELLTLLALYLRFVVLAQHVTFADLGLAPKFLFFFQLTKVFKIAFVIALFDELLIDGGALRNDDLTITNSESACLLFQRAHDLRYVVFLHLCPLCTVIQCLRARCGQRFRTTLTRCLRLY